MRVRGHAELHPVLASEAVHFSCELEYESLEKAESNMVISRMIRIFVIHYHSTIHSRSAVRKRRRLAPHFHNNWARHCNDYRNEEDDDAEDENDEDKNDEDKNDDEDDDVDQPGRCAAGVGDARVNEPGSRAQRVAEPKKRCGPKKTEPLAAAPKRGRRDSAGDQGAQIAKRPKSRVARCSK